MSRVRVQYKIAIWYANRRKLHKSGSEANVAYIRYNLSLKLDDENCEEKRARNVG